MDLTKRLAAALPAVLIVAGGCNPRRPDPPPPAASVALPVAPPGATVARAAGKTPLPSGTTFSDPDQPEDPLLPEDEEDDEGPLAPVPPAPAVPAPADGGGVTL